MGSAASEAGAEAAGPKGRGGENRWRAAAELYARMRQNRIPRRIAGATMALTRRLPCAIRSVTRPGLIPVTRGRREVGVGGQSVGTRESGRRVRTQAAKTSRWLLG